MSRNKKLLQAIRNNPKDVRFDDAIRAAEFIGFTAKGGAGSHTTLARPGEPKQLNFQEGSHGKAKPYQVKQLIEMMDKYEDAGLEAFPAPGSERPFSSDSEEPDSSEGKDDE